MFVKIEILLIMCQKRRENGRNVTSSRASNMGWLWTGRIGPAPVQIMLSVRRAVVIVCGLLQGFIIFSLTSRFFVNSHLDDSRAWIPACLLTVALLHRCFPSNLSTTTQGAIVKLRGASSVLCTLFIWSVQNSKTALARSPLRRTVLGYVGKRRWGVEGYWYFRKWVPHVQAWLSWSEQDFTGVLGTSAIHMHTKTHSHAWHRPHAEALIPRPTIYAEICIHIHIHMCINA